MSVPPGQSNIPEAASASNDGILHVVMMLAIFFLQTPENLKTETAEESFNPDGLAQRSIKLLKDTFPDIEVSFCAYAIP